MRILGNVASVVASRRVCLLVALQNIHASVLLTGRIYAGFTAHIKSRLEHKEEVKAIQLKEKQTVGLSTE